MEFRQEQDWQASMQSWAAILREALLAHPNLAQLMTLDHRGPIANYTTELLKVLLAAGFDEELALRSCRVLLNIAISLTLSELAAPAGPGRRKRRSQQEILFEDLVIARSGKDPDHFREPPEVFENAINWVIAGIETEFDGHRPPD